MPLYQVEDEHGTYDFDSDTELDDNALQGLYNTEVAKPRAREQIINELVPLAMERDAKAQSLYNQSLNLVEGTDVGATEALAKAAGAKFNPADQAREKLAALPKSEGLIDVDESTAEKVQASDTDYLNKLQREVINRVDPEDREQVLADIKTAADVRRGYKDSAVVNGKLEVNPELIWSDDMAKTAIGTTEASDAQKAELLEKLPSMREQAAQAQLPELQKLEEFRKFQADNPELKTPVEQIQGYKGDRALIDRIGQVGAQAKLGIASGATSLASQADASLGAGLRAADKLSMGIIPGIGGVSDSLIDTAIGLNKQAGEIGQMRENVGGPAIVGDIVEGGTSLLPAIALATPVGRAAKILGYSAEAASALGFGTSIGASGLQSFGSVYPEAVQKLEEEKIAQGMSPEAARQQASDEAYVPAALSGISTMAITALGGKAGVESIFRVGAEEGIEQATKTLFKKAIEKSGVVAKDFANEAIEEGSDQFVQGIIALHTFDPDKPMSDIVRESYKAAVIGGILGGGVGTLKEVANSWAKEKIAPAVEQARASGAPETADALESISQELVDQKFAKAEEAIAKYQEENAKAKETSVQSEQPSASESTLPTEDQSALPSDTLDSEISLPTTEQPQLPPEQVEQPIESVASPEQTPVQPEVQVNEEATAQVTPSPTTELPVTTESVPTTEQAQEAVAPQDTAIQPQPNGDVVVDAEGQSTTLTADQIQKAKDMPPEEKQAFIGRVEERVKANALETGADEVTADKVAETHVAKWESVLNPETTPSVTAVATPEVKAAKVTLPTFDAATEKRLTQMEKIDPKAALTDRVALTREKLGDNETAALVGLTPEHVADFDKGTNKTGINPNGYGQNGLDLEISKRIQAGNAAPASTPTATTPTVGTTDTSTPVETPAPTADEDPREKLISQEKPPLPEEIGDGASEIYEARKSRLKDPNTKAVMTMEKNDAQVYPEAPLPEGATETTRQGIKATHTKFPVITVNGEEQGRFTNRTDATAQQINQGLRVVVPQSFVNNDAVNPTIKVERNEDIYEKTGQTVYEVVAVNHPTPRIGKITQKGQYDERLETNADFLKNRENQQNRKGGVNERAREGFMSKLDQTVNKEIKQLGRKTLPQPDAEKSKAYLKKIYGTDVTPGVDINKKFGRNFIPVMVDAIKATATRAYAHELSKWQKGKRKGVEPDGDTILANAVQDYGEKIKTRPELQSQTSLDAPIGEEGSVTLGEVTAAAEPERATSLQDDPEIRAILDDATSKLSDFQKERFLSAREKMLSAIDKAEGLGNNVPQAMIEAYGELRPSEKAAWDTVQKMVTDTKAQTLGASLKAKPRIDFRTLANLESGRYVPDRIPEATRRENEQLPLKQAESVARRSHGAIRTLRGSVEDYTQAPEGLPRYEAQGKLASLARPHEDEALREWAERTGHMLDAQEFTDKWEAQGQKGKTEHQVYFDEEQQRWFKRSNLFQNYENGQLGYLQRIILHNSLFPDTALKFEGYMDVDGELMPVVSQDHFAGDPVSAEDFDSVDSYMEKLGFKIVDQAQGIYEKNGIIVSDLNPENIVWVDTPEGKALAIYDPVVKLNENTKVERLTEMANAGETLDTDNDLMSAILNQARLQRAGATPVPAQADHPLVKVVEDKIAKEISPSTKVIPATHKNGNVMWTDGKNVYVDPVGLQAALDTYDQEQGEALLDRMINEEGQHIKGMSVIPRTEAERFGSRLSVKKAEDTARAYINRSQYATQAEYEQAVRNFKADHYTLAHEYLRMLRQKFQNGTTTEDMQVPNEPGLLNTIRRYLRAALEFLKARYEVTFDPQVADMMARIQTAERALGMRASTAEASGMTAEEYAALGAESPELAASVRKPSQALYRVLAADLPASTKQIINDKEYVTDTWSAAEARANKWIDDQGEKTSVADLDAVANQIDGAYMAEEDKMYAKAAIALRYNKLMEAMKAGEVTMDNAMLFSYIKAQHEKLIREVQEGASRGGQMLAMIKGISKMFVPQTYVNSYTGKLTKQQAAGIEGKPGEKEVAAAIDAGKQAGADAAVTRGLKALKKLLPDNDAAQGLFDFFADALSLRETGTIQGTGIPPLQELKAEVAKRLSKMLIGQTGIKPQESIYADLERKVTAAVDAQLKAPVYGPEEAPATEEEQRKALLASLVEQVGNLDLVEQTFNQAVQDTLAGTPKSMEARIARLQGLKFDREQFLNAQKFLQTAVDFKDLVTQTLEAQDSELFNLLAAVAESTGLNGEQAQLLADAIRAGFDQEAQRVARKELNKIHEAFLNKERDKGQIKLTEPQIKKLLKMVNLGAFSEEKYYNALAESFGLPTWDEEFADKIEKEGERIQKMPLNSDVRNEAASRLLTSIAYEKVANFKRNWKSNKLKTAWYFLGDVFPAIWQAGVLSGPPTQFVNYGATQVNILMSAAANASGYVTAANRNGIKTVKLGDFLSDVIVGSLQSFGWFHNPEGNAAVQEFKKAVSTGVTRFRNEKGEEMGLLEQEPIGMLHKYVGRFMAGIDAMNQVQANKIKQRMALRYAWAAKDLTRDEVHVMMENAFNPVQTVLDQIDSQVEAESEWLPKKLDKQRRRTELIEKRRFEMLDGLDEISRAAAEKDSFNNRPEGLLGLIFEKVIQPINANAKLTRLVLSFFGTLSNIINTSADWSPYGILRGYNASINSTFSKEQNQKYKTFFEPGSPEQYAQLTKAYVGTMAIGAIMALAAKGLDDEDKDKEPFFAIYGIGPEDVNDKTQLEQGSNWAANTVKIGSARLRYTDFPAMGPILGVLGQISDMHRYKKSNDPRSEADKALSGALALGQQLLTKNMLSGLDTFFKIMADPTGRGVGASKRLASGAIGGVTNPQLFKWARNTMAINDRGMVPTIDTTSTWEGWMKSITPFTGWDGAPYLNTLGEPIEKLPWEVSLYRAGQYEPTPNHPVLTPLVDAGLLLPAPSKMVKVTVNGEKQMVGQDVQIWRRFVQLRGEELKKRLTPDDIKKLTSMDSEKAQNKIDGQINDQARQSAVNRLEKELKAKNP